MKRRHFRRRRRGYVMVLLAMLLFGLMATAALVIDLGLARLAQRQMQSAADAAALEGLRGENLLDFELRQQNAEAFIAWQFDDDLDADNGDDGTGDSGGSFGAGPVVAFSGGAGDPSLNASHLITIDPDNATFKPTMQHGAEIEGEFRISLQRGGELDDAASLYSQGSSVPYLFARGSLINRDLLGSGITVRAESTAVAARALAVGLPVVDRGGDEVYPGAIAIGYRLADWNGTRSDPQHVGAAKTQIGQSVTVEGPATTLVEGYCCIYADISGSDRVVGFGMIESGAAVPRFVAIANATGRLSDVWADMDPEVRDALLARNGSVIGGLLVATPQPRS